MSVVYGLTLASAVAVEERTHSSAQIGLVIVSSILPAFVASLFAGAVVDRIGKRPVLVASLALRVATALGFWGALQLSSPVATLVAIYIVNAAGIAASQFTASAEASLLPDLVEPDRLQGANSLFQLSLLAAEGLGLVLLAPLTIKLAGASAMGLVGAGFSLVALLLATTLPAGLKPDAAAAKPSRSGAGFAAELRAGWRTLAHDRVLGAVTVQMTLASVLLLILLSLLPVLLSRTLGLRVEDVPFLLLPGGIGFGVGLALNSRIQWRLSRPACVAAGLVGLGGALGLLALVSHQSGPAALPLMILLIVAIGLALAMIIVPARTVLQERPPAAVRGRVIAAQLAIGNAVAVLPVLLGGGLADQMGIQPVIGLLGMVAAGTGAVGWHYARS